MLTDKIQHIKEESEKDFSTVKNQKDLEEFRIKYLSRNGLLAHLFEELKKVPKEDKPVVGKNLNELRNSLTERFDSLKSDIEKSNGTSDPKIDLTLPGAKRIVGSKHIIIQTLDEIKS